MSEATSPLDVVLGPARRIGHYFGLVSGLTSVVPVAFLLMLMASGAPADRPSVDRVVSALGSLGIVGFGVLTGLTLVLGLLLHPLQFALTQVLEGYWGAAPTLRLAMKRSALQHLDRWYALWQLSGDARDDAIKVDREYEEVVRELASSGLKPKEEDRLRWRERILVEQRLIASIDAQEANRALARYPAAAQVMPTRLGNVLRRFEAESQQMYGLDAISAMPYIGLLAEPPHREYLDDQRSAMDLAVRLCLVWSLCTLVGVALLWRHDVWLVLPALSYGLVLLSYRGAVASAMHYGQAITALVTLTRPALYDRLRVRLPTDTDDEKRINQSLSLLLRGEPAFVEYRRDDVELVTDSVRPSLGPELPSDAFLP